MESFFKQLSVELQEASTPKVREAMELFEDSTPEMRKSIICATGFSGDVNGENLQNHFDTLELMDILPAVLEDMKTELGDVEKVD